MDEVFEVVTLVQTGKLSAVPILLYGSDYWQGILSWMADTMLPAGYVLPQDLQLARPTDDLEEVVATMVAAHAGAPGPAGQAR